MVLTYSNVSKRCRWNGNSVDPDLTRQLLQKQSDLGLHCLPRPDWIIMLVTVKRLKIRTPEKITVIILKFD